MFSIDYLMTRRDLSLINKLIIINIGKTINCICTVVSYGTYIYI